MEVLCYGQGNTLVHMPELIAQALDVPARIEVEPAKRVGERNFSAEGWWYNQQRFA